MTIADGPPFDDPVFCHRPTDRGWIAQHSPGSGEFFAIAL